MLTTQGETLTDRIELRSPDGSRREIPLANSRLMIGRSPDCTIRLDSDLISRQHAELIHDPFGRWWIYDLGSRNGIKINGKRVLDHVIAPGDSIRIGKFELRLLAPAATSMATTTGTALPVESNQPALRLRTLDDQPATALTAAHLELLLELGSQLLTTPEKNDRQRLLCQAIVAPSFGARAAFVLAVGNDTERPQVIFSLMSAGTDEDSPHVSQTLVKAMAAIGKPVMGTNAVDEQAAMTPLTIDSSARPTAGIACPMGEGSDLALYVAIDPSFSKPEWLHLTALAVAQWNNAETAWRERQAASQQEAIERELLNARQIQQSLMPPPAPMQDCDWSLRMEPCRWVGGDYADVVRFPDGRIFAGIADVCGKGLHAAMVGASLHTLVRTALLGDIPLGKIMDRANQYFCQFLPPGSFVTMTAVIYDPAGPSIQYVNAGHPPPFVITPGDGEHGATVNVFDGPGGFPLGVAREDFETGHATIPIGSAFVIFTDGCTDLLSPGGDRLHTDDLQRCLMQAATATTPLFAQGLVDCIFTMMESHRAGCQAPDDRTVLACVLGNQMNKTA